MILSAIIPHYFGEARWENLVEAVNALRSGSFQPGEIVVWNNERELPLRPRLHASVIQSYRNLGPSARFLAALASKGDFLFFQDNDVSCGHRTVEQLLTWARDLPNTIVSLDGYYIDEGMPYSSRRRTQCAGVRCPTELTVTLGRMEIVARTVLLQILKEFPLGLPVEMDDLEFSACAKRLGIPIWCVPAERFNNLPERGIGASFGEGYYLQREEHYARLFGRAA